MKILFLAPNPKFQFASQRFRFELYFNVLTQVGFTYDYQTFFELKTTNIIYQKGNLLKKMWGVVLGFTKRMICIFRLHKYDYIFIHREATSIGPPIIEWIVSKLLRKKIIFDFDDSLWVPVSSGSKALAYLKWPSKTKKICSYAYKVSAGNIFLADFAKQYCSSVSILPTIVDVHSGHNQLKNQSDHPLVIGWTGTFSNFKFFDLMLSALQDLESNYAFEFRVIADKNPLLPLNSFRYLPWQKETEIDDLIGFHIGVMPLFDNEITRGKCGFKAIQYMSIGIPALVSPVAVNAKIVDHGINGFHCQTKEDWYNYLELLIKNVALRTEMGLAARKKIVEHYSIEANKETFLSLFS
jgi:glycosyltransferase involved in cell wall biosynthesis